MNGLAGLWHYALSYVQNGGVSDSYLTWMRNLPNVSQVTDQGFLSEMAWSVYNAGMKEALIRKKWPFLKSAYLDFCPEKIAANEEEVLQSVMALFRHEKKALAVITGAKKVVADSPVGKKIAQMDEAEALIYLESYPFIGKVTKYHLARNIGFDCVKPDRHLVRITEYLGYPSPDALVSKISSLTGERKGFIDYILWQWLAWQGRDAYGVIDCHINNKGV